MSQPHNWLVDIVQDASKKVADRPAARRSDYWEERRRQIDANRKTEQEAQAAAKERQR